VIKIQHNWKQGLFSILTRYVHDVCSNSGLSKSSSKVWTFSSPSSCSPAITQIHYVKHLCLVSFQASLIDVCQAQLNSVLQEHWVWHATKTRHFHQTLLHHLQ